ncbi:major facilitator superfamily domain-containing protein 8-like [Clavelina lepadiformis]|uniref:major facilitator superfamily domain-containing protein 8-like n=1 Tax=Clavelina lepadiformis TaxID=159417 RepID=UPI00404312DA
MVKKLSPTFIIICLYYLLSGVEYAVILPTLNMYLASLNASSFFIGMVLSSFSLTGLLSAPLYGQITDVTGSTKATVMVSNLFEIGGNFMYFAATGPYMVMGSRLIAGLGSGSGSSILGMISRSTSNEERTAAFSQLMSLRQMGLIIGPAFNIFLAKLDFYIGNFHVNSLTSPGIFMALLWVIHELLMACFYHEIPLLKKSSGYASVNSTSDDESSSTEGTIIRRPRSETRFLTYVYNDLLREEVIVCLTVTFMVMFVQTGIETLLTPLTKQLFGWEELPNSLFFCVAGLLLVVSFFSLAKLSEKFSDRRLLVVGTAIMSLLYVLFLFFVIFGVREPKGTVWVLVVFCIHSVILVLDLPFVWVPQASLFSKVTSEKTQAFNQGIRLLVMGLGQILGPLWAASLLKRLPVFAAVNLFLILLLLIMITASYKRLEVATQPNSNGSHPTATENTPLLTDRHSSVNA